MKKIIITFVFSLLFLSQFNSQITLIPDPAFEIRLILLGIDTGIATNGFVPTSFVTSVTSLSLASKGINSLVGIEDFTALENLDCSLNSLDSIDVTNNLALKRLWMHNNGMVDSTIDLSNNINLTHLSIGSNDLKEIDLSNNTKLKVMWTIFNYIDSIDLSNNKDLDTVEIAFNRLKYIKLSDSSNFTRFDVGSGNNDISGDLDLSNHSNLIHLNIVSNSFTSLDLANGNNNRINYISAWGNPFLSCILVDDTLYSQTNWRGSSFYFDTASSFKLFCGPNCQPKFHPTQLTAGGVYLIDSTTGSNLKYTWYFGDGDSSNLYLPTHNYTSAGTYNVCLSIEDTLGGCSNIFCDTIIVDSTGVLRNSWTLTVVKSEPFLDLDEEVFESLNIFPNPTTGNLNIEFDKKGSYVIYSMEGKQLVESSTIKNSLTKVDLSILKSGVYFLQVTTDTGSVITKKILKQ
jgi:hypothetical protein